MSQSASGGVFPPKWKGLWFAPNGDLWDCREDEWFLVGRASRRAHECSRCGEQM